MIDFLHNILGPYFREAFSLIASFLETQLCICIFAAKQPKRRCFSLRAGGMLLCGSLLFLCLSVPSTDINQIWGRILCNLMITVFCFLCTLVLYEGSLENISLLFCAGVAAHEVTARVSQLIRLLQGIDDRGTASFFHSAAIEMAGWEWIVFYLFHLIMYFLLAVLFRPKANLTRDRETSRNISLLFASILVTVNILTCISRVYEWESVNLTIYLKAFSLYVHLMILFICAGVCSQNEKSRQLEVLQQMWKQDQAQFQSVKANMDAINMKCHDLKHFLNRVEGKLDDEELEQLRKAVEFYDSNIRTGSEVLDVVLCEKALLCQQNGIQFQCMADGSLLSFMTAVQIYTVFGNVMENAVEAVSKLDDPEKKLICLTCRKSPSHLLIEQSNFCVLGSTTDRTSKMDASRHGFGLKSIRYIVSQYGGTVETKQNEDMFFLSICFPLSHISKRT